MKIVFCSSEVVPFVKTGGLADVAGALPLVLERLGLEIIIVMPLYKGIETKKFGIRRFNDFSATTQIGKNIKVFFINHEEYFNRDGLYGDKTGDFPDNLERFQYYCSKTLALLKALKIQPDILHCHDWQTALIPVYLKVLYQNDHFFEQTKTLFTIHNLAYQGVFPKSEFPKLRLPKNLFSIDGFEFYDQVNLLKAGILYCDCITTVSPMYSKEIQTQEKGCGLDGVLRSRCDKVVGILNGLDYDFWNPQTDQAIVKNFSEGDFKGKRENKTCLKEYFHLPEKEDTPLLGFVGRLTSQKGIDLIYQAVDEIGKLDLQMILLGTGEEKYHKILKEMNHRFPKRIAVHLKFDEKMAHQIYAGSDIFLMPSQYEPCGLSQMISLRYGTIPLVFQTGGLKDTIFPFDSDGKKGNGFVFTEYNKNAFMEAIKKAVQTYKNKKVFAELFHQAFTYRFTWEDSAQKYMKVYERSLALAKVR